jgi:hypothetical protein
MITAAIAAPQRYRVWRGRVCPPRKAGKEMTNQESAAKTACFALLAAADFDRFAADRKELLISAIQLAMDATGHELRRHPSAANEIFGRISGMIREARR